MNIRVLETLASQTTSSTPLCPKLAWILQMENIYNDVKTFLVENHCPVILFVILENSEHVA